MSVRAGLVDVAPVTLEHGSDFFGSVIGFLPYHVDVLRIRCEGQGIFVVMGVQDLSLAHDMSG